METGFFGRVGKSVIMSLRVNHRSDKPKLNSTDLKALEAILTWLECDKPRLISPPVDSKGCLLFTDGACEGFDKGFPTVTCGALLINLDTGERFLFGTKVSDPLVTKWVKELQKKQLVTEAEMFAVLISFRLWFEFFVGKKVIIFVDSEPTMFSFIRGTANSEVCAEIVRQFFILQAKCQCFQWFARVPTKSNPADMPSRLMIHEAAVAYNATVVEIPEPNFVS